MEDRGGEKVKSEKGEREKPGLRLSENKGGKLRNNGESEERSVVCEFRDLNA